MNLRLTVSEKIRKTANEIFVHGLTVISNQENFNDVSFWSILGYTERGCIFAFVSFSQ